MIEHWERSRKSTIRGGWRYCHNKPCLLHGGKGEKKSLIYFFFLSFTRAVLLYSHAAARQQHLRDQCIELLGKESS